MTDPTNGVLDVRLTAVEEEQLRQRTRWHDELQPRFSHIEVQLARLEDQGAAILRAIEDLKGLEPRVIALESDNRTLKTVAIAAWGVLLLLIGEVIKRWFFAGAK